MIAQGQLESNVQSEKLSTKEERLAGLRQGSSRYSHRDGNGILEAFGGERNRCGLNYLLSVGIPFLVDDWDDDSTLPVAAVHLDLLGGCVFDETAPITCQW
jgi:hypothetical protein